MRKYFRFIIFLGITILLFIIVRVTEPKSIDWSLSFSKDDKIPYGSFIVFRILPELFPEKKISISEYPIYNFLKGRKFRNSNYIFIDNSYSPDELDTKELLNFVNDGNNVFIAANFIGGKLSDSLKIFTSLDFVGSDSFKINFYNEKLKRGVPYKFKNSSMDCYFANFDSSASTVLGYNEKKKINFIKIKFGKGNFYLNTVPLAFTNYNILDSLNSDYIFKSLSYLPSDNSTFWDEYYKEGKAEIRTPLRFILNTVQLKWAYFILLFSIIIYIIFEGKRKQRIIPEIKPLQNTTVEFAGVIGKLYYQKKNHKNIAMKKINFFLDQVRNRYFIRVDENKEEVVQKISKKSGVAVKEVKSIFNFISYIEIKSKIKENELKRINSLIESFYKKAGIYGRSN